MHYLDTPPEAYPGPEFCLHWGDEQIYEIGHLRYTRGTGSEDLLLLPDIEYRSFAEIDFGRGTEYIDGGAGKIAEGLLDEGQLSALKTARSIESRREMDDPNLDSFVALSRVKADNNGLLYVCAAEEGGRLQSDEPFAMVKEAERLGIVDFATATLGYYGLFKFNAGDIEEFVPPELADRVNAYTLIDEPRVVVGPNSDHDYQIVKLMLLNVETDMTFPLGALDRTFKIITVNEDGSEDVQVVDPDADD